MAITIRWVTKPMVAVYGSFSDNVKHAKLYSDGHEEEELNRIIYQGQGLK